MPYWKRQKKKTEYFKLKPRMQLLLAGEMNWVAFISAEPTTPEFTKKMSHKVHLRK